jgi:VanZ family protein
MKRLLYWIPAICIAFLISGFSTHYFSGEQTSRIIVPFFHWLFPGASAQTLRLIHVAIRKMAHMMEFGAFSMSIFYGVRADQNGWTMRWSVITLLIAVCYAGLDEWHQSFVPKRQARLDDVLLDLTGAFLAQAVVYLVVRFRRSRAEAQNFSAARLEPHP